VWPGQAWTKAVSFRFFGSPVSYTVASTYLRIEHPADEDAAVVRSTMTFPMKISVPMGSLGKAFGFKSPLPASAVLHETARISSTTTTWIGLTSKRIRETTSTSDMSLSVSVSGLKLGQRVPDITIDGTLSMTLLRT
jgi:hypothetical protein